MIFKVYAAKEDPAVFAEIEGNTPFEAYQHLTTELTGFYGSRKAIFEEKDYREIASWPKNKQLYHAVVHEGKQYGQVKVKYLDETPKYKLGKHWMSQRFVVDFLFAKDIISQKEKQRFLDWMKR